jgi:iron complex transport system ATP-binding protein
MIQVKNLTYTIGKKQILNNISFQIEKGKIYGILGTNGSGKSTLLKALSRINPVKSSTIFLDGKDINQYSSKQLAQTIALVPQQTNLMFDFSALQLALMGRIPYQKPLYSDSEEDLAIVKESMLLTNTWHLRDMNAQNLSGGEFQRLIIARALSQQTPVLMLDEPVSALDIRHQFDIMNLLKKINKDTNTTILIILHDLNLALKYCDEVILLNKGELVAKGESKQVLTQENISKHFGIKVDIVDNWIKIIQ